MFPAVMRGYNRLILFADTGHGCFRQRRTSPPQKVLDFLCGRGHWRVNGGGRGGGGVGGKNIHLPLDMKFSVFTALSLLLTRSGPTLLQKEKWGSTPQTCLGPDTVMEVDR